MPAVAFMQDVPIWDAVGRVTDGAFQGEAVIVRPTSCVGTEKTVYAFEGKLLK